MIPDGASLMIGGFMAVGSSERLIDELVRQGKRNLTVIANDTASYRQRYRQTDKCGPYQLFATSPTDGNSQKVGFCCSLMSINFR